MDLAILSRRPDLYSTRRLVEAAEALGHAVRVLDTLRCTIHLSARGPELHYDGEKLPDLDAVIPRIGASVTFYGLAVLRQFEAMGVYCLNGSIAVNRSRDKLRAHQLLAKRGVGLPATAFAHRADSADDLVRSVGGPPVVVKLLEGTQGVGVVLCETKTAAQSVIEAFRGLRAYFLVQEYIAEAGGADLRVLVVGGEAAAAMRRQGADGEFRSNLHRGGRAEPVALTPEEERTAVEAVEALGQQAAGVDVLRSNRGPLVLEVNSSPGLEGIERATGVDVASRIVRHVEKRVRVGILEG
jgi:ribosomal protein S6--L-glutamate ligase